MERKEILEMGLRPNKEQITQRSDQYLKIYANSVNMGVSLWDINLTFGEIVGEEDGQPVVEQKVKVNMSKEFAKAVLNLLKLNIGQYEEQFGEIQLINQRADEIQQQALAEADNEKTAKKRVAKGAAKKKARR